MSGTVSRRLMAALRTERFTESVIREMTRLADEHDAINLAQGFPDFPAPLELKKAAGAAIMNDINQYAITWGAKSLRDALARKYREFNGMAVLPKDRFEMENFRRHASGIRNIIFSGATDLTKFVYVVRYAVRST